MVGIVGVAVAILAIALRFVATNRTGRKPGWEDWFAVLATLFYIFYVVPFLYSRFNSVYLVKLPHYTYVGVGGVKSMTDTICSYQLWCF